MAYYNVDKAHASGRPQVSSSPHYEAVTKSDTANFNYTARGLYVGGAGDVVAVTPDGDAVTFTGVQAGSVLPIECIRVNSTSTTATSMVALF